MTRAGLDGPSKTIIVIPEEEPMAPEAPPEKFPEEAPADPEREPVKEPA